MSRDDVKANSFSKRKRRLKKERTHRWLSMAYVVLITEIIRCADLVSGQNPFTGTTRKPFITATENGADDFLCITMKNKENPNATNWIMIGGKSHSP